MFAIDDRHSIPRFHMNVLIAIEVGLDPDLVSRLQRHKNHLAAWIGYERTPRIFIGPSSYLTRCPQPDHCYSPFPGYESKFPYRIDSNMSQCPLQFHFRWIAVRNKSATLSTARYPGNKQCCPHIVANLYRRLPYFGLD